MEINLAAIERGRRKRKGKGKWWEGEKQRIFLDKGRTTAITQPKKSGESTTRTSTRKIMLRVCANAGMIV